MSSVLVAENYPANDNAYMEFTGFKDSGLFTVSSAVKLSEARVALAFHSGFLVDNSGHVYVELLDSSGTVLATSTKLLPQLVNWDFSETAFYFSGVNQIQLATGTQYRLRVRTDSLWDYGGGGWLEIAIRSGNVAFRLYGSITGFTVTYFKWEGGAITGAPPVDPNVYQNGATVTVLGQGSMQWLGNIFSAWRPRHSPSTAYKPGQTFVINRNFEFDDDWVYARTLTYNGNGNTGGSAPTDGNSPYASGSTVTVLGHGNLVKTDHVFKGWATSASGAVAYTQGQTFQISANTILYAVWAPTFTVTYNANGGSGAPTNTNRYEQGQTFTAAQPGGMTNGSNVFQRWNTASNGSGTSYNAGATVTMGSANLVLYAQWSSASTFTVTYNGNNNTGGAVPSDGTLYSSGNTVTVKANTGNLVRTSYRFMGWATTNNAVTPTYAVSGSTVTPSTFTISANTILYAVWTREYTLTYNGNTHTSGSAPTDSNNPYLSGTNATVLGQGNLLKTDHTFLGWDTSASATVASYQPGNTIVMSSDRILYAIWKDNNQTQTPTEMASTTAATANNFRRIATKHPSAYNTVISSCASGFKGNGLQITKVQFQLMRNESANNVEIVAKIYNATTGNIGLPDGNPLAVSNPVLFNTISNSSIVWVDFNFTGSNLFTTVANANYVVAISCESAGLSNSNAAFPQLSVYDTNSASGVVHNNSNNTLYTFYANAVGAGSWQLAGMSISLLFKVIGAPPIPLSVTYNGNGYTGGSVPVDSSSPYVAGSTVTVLGQGSLVRDNYTFQGWATSVGGAVVYTQGQTFQINADTILYAVWQENPKYTVTYNGNTHTGGSVPASQTGYVNTQISVANKGSLVKANYTFLRWNTLANGTGTSYNEGAGLTLTANVTLYAIWQENPKYTVTYNGSGHTGGNVPLDINSPYYTGTAVTVLGQGTLTKTDYVFLGWDTDSSASTVLYTQGNTFTISANMTLYAVWLYKPKFSVTYDANGASSGNVPLDSNSYYPDDPVTVAANTGSLSRSGYTFLGWSFNKSAVAPDFTVTGSIVSPSTFNMGSGNETLYAVWELIPTYSVVYFPNWPNNIAGLGSAPVDNNKYQAGASFDVLANSNGLSRVGFIFLGWDTNASATVPSFEVSGSTVNPSTSTMQVGGVNLYAIWEEDTVIVVPDTYTVTYHANFPVGSTGSGNVPVDSLEYLENSIVTVLGSGSLEVEGYEFLGWATVANAVNVEYEENTTFTMGTDDVDLYGVWIKQSEVKITYHGNGHTGGSVPVDGNNPYFAGAVVTVLGSGSLVKLNYTFKGWSLSASGSIDYMVGSSFTITENTTLYAIWQENPKYTVTYHGNGADSGSPPIDSKLYYAGESVTVLDKNTLAFYGYTFLGWSYIASDTTPTILPSQTFTMSNSNEDLFAVWQAMPRYTVAYMPNDASDGLPPTDFNEYLAFETVTIKANPLGLVREGYRFLGWSSNIAATVPDYAVFNTQVVPINRVMGNNNLVLYAVWEPIVMYTVSYHKNGADSGEVPSNSHTYVPGSIVSVRPNMFNLGRVGYTFIGWSTNPLAIEPEFTVIGNDVSPATFPILANTELFAVWKVRTIYPVTYHANWPFDTTGLGNVPIDNNIYYDGYLVTVFPNVGNLRVNGYTFIGWMFNSQFFEVNDENIVHPSSLVITGIPVSFFAVWTQDKPVEPKKYNYYGTLLDVKNLCRMGISDTSPLLSLDVHDELLEQFLEKATRMINGYLQLAQVVTPLQEPFPDMIVWIANLYASGHYLQRELGDNKMHRNIVEALESMKLYMKIVYGIDPDAKPGDQKQPSVTIVGDKCGGCYT